MVIGSNAVMRAVLVFPFLLVPILAVALPALAAGNAPPAGDAAAEAPAAIDAPSEETDWMVTALAEERAQTERVAGRIMTAIECRFAGRLDVDSGEGTEFRFAFADNRAGTGWTWREFPAIELKAMDRQLSGEGFALVANQEFERHPSGQKRICALWHR